LANERCGNSQLSDFSRDAAKYSVLLRRDTSLFCV